MTAHLYRDIVGSTAWDALPPVLHQFHDRGGDGTFTITSRGFARVFSALGYAPSPGTAAVTLRVERSELGERWARRHGKPMVGNGDVHRLEQLGTTYSLVDAEPEPDAICDAIRAGRVQIIATPLTFADAALLMTKLVASTFVPRRRALQAGSESRLPSPGSRTTIPRIRLG